MCAKASRKSCSPLTMIFPSQRRACDIPRGAYAATMSGGGASISLEYALCGCSRRAACHIGLHHLLRIDDAVELRLGDKSQLPRGRLQREIALHGVVGNLRGLVV